jgi:hypothetical protein
VSAQEALVYSLKHPESTTAKKAEKAAAAHADRLGTHIDTLA